MAILADRESRLLIDGKLVTGSAGTFPTINPATEETLGVAADASADDMGAAIAAARRAFDETDWSTHLGARDGRMVLYLLRVPSRMGMGSIVHVGSRLPAACDPVSKPLVDPT